MKLSGTGGALLAVALPFAVSGVASASPDITLTLTVTAPKGDTQSVRLTCAPAGGSHPDATGACAELFTARGDFDILPGEPEQTMCTMEYLPVTAAAEGRWRGKPVSWEHEFGNACTLHNATGRVFLF